mgnify:CR=1 FL=1
MKFKIEISCNNDAFYPIPQLEVESILRKVIYRLKQPETPKYYGFALFDSNGNKVGEAEFIDG